MGIIKYFKTFCHAELVNHILEAIQENPLISSSTVKEVSARI
jgi:hypothetical protein